MQCCAFTQVLCGRLVEMYPLKPHQLLLQTMTLQGGLLLAVGPVLDKWLTGERVHCTCCMWLSVLSF